MMMSSVLFLVAMVGASFEAQAGCAAFPFWTPLDSGKVGCLLGPYSNNGTCTGTGGACSVVREIEGDDLRFNTYYGYRDGVNKSPSNGRLNSALARIDACFTGGYSVTNQLQNIDQCYDVCQTTQNSACNNSSGSTCDILCEEIQSHGQWPGAEL